MRTRGFCAPLECVQEVAFFFLGGGVAKVYGIASFGNEMQMIPSLVVTEGVEHEGESMFYPLTSVSLFRSPKYVSAG
jgi:hypothetical protein